MQQLCCYVNKYHIKISYEPENGKTINQKNKRKIDSGLTDRKIVFLSKIGFLFHFEQTNFEESF